MWCEQINHNLTFYPQKIESCCSGFQGPIFLENPTNKVELDWEEIKRKKLEFIKRLENNDVPDDCMRCPYLKQGKTPENEDFRYSKIFLNHFTHCNCKCVYCARLRFYHRDYTEVSKSPDFYHVLPMLKSLFALGEEEINKKQMKIDFQGGDLCVLDEFEDIMEFFIEQDFKRIDLTTNNIVYQPVIERCLRENRCVLISSLDCGCRETYRKIKGVDKFDVYIDNLRRYAAVAENTHRFLISYIIIQKFNDNLEEAQKFLNLMKELGMVKIRLEIDYNDLFGYKGDFVIPKHYYEIFDLFNDFAANNNMTIMYTQYTKEIFEKGYCGK